MSNLTIFNNEHFGEIRTIIKDGEPWFIGKDVCAAFGDTNHNRSLSRVDAEDKETVEITDSLGRKQSATAVNESGLYTLLWAMQPQKANNNGVSDAYPIEVQERIVKLREFKQWITHDVLPSIRKTGGYQTKPMTHLEILAAQAQALVEQERRMTAIEETTRQLDAKLDESTKALDAKLDKATEAFTAPSFAADKWQENARTTIAAIVQENNLSYQSYTGELYQRLESVACVNLKSRQGFKQKRMKEQGATYRERQAVTKLNVIADDPKLRAIFDHILAVEKASRLMKGGRTA